MSEAYAYEAEPFGEDIGQEVLPVYEPQPRAPRAARKLIANLQKVNLADDLDDAELSKIGAKVVEEYKLDVTSRKSAGWDERNKAAMDLAMLVAEEKSYPWPMASNVKFPTIATAAIQFNARAYPAVIDGSNVVKGKVLGQPTEEKRARADRIGRHMSYQLLEEMDGWEEDTDRLLMMLPIVGCVFRKTWFDPLKGYNCSHLVPPDKFVVNYWTKDLESCPRATHVLDDIYPHQIEERIRAGAWIDFEYGLPPNAQNDDHAPHTFLEQHRLLDLDDDGYPKPYIVTVHEETQKVVRILPRYDESGVVAEGAKIVRVVPARSFTKYGFIPAPDGSFYDIGFGTLLGPLSKTINGTINQLMDAGHLANTGGGFLGNGASLKAGNVRFAPGEWKKVEVTGTTLRENVVPLPVTPPSPVLFQLLGMLVEASRDLTATQDILTGDTVQSNQPVGTTLAMIEQGLKTFTAIVKRIHRALKSELACLYRLNSLYLQPEAYFVFQDVEGAIAQKDYALGDVDVVPVSDPTMATDMQRLGRAQFLMQFRQDPLMDGAEINKRVLESASIDEIDALFAKQQQPPPEVVDMIAKGQREDRKLGIDEMKAQAEIANKDAQTQKITAETFLMGPQFALAVQQAVDARLAQLENRQDGQVQQPDVPGMEGPPADGALPPLPEGFPGGPGPAMGFGPGDGPGGPADGQDPGGDFGPQF